MPSMTVNVRYMVDDVDAAVAWYTKHLGFTLLSNAAPAFADVTLGSLRLLLSGPTSSAGRPMADGARSAPGGWNRIHLIVDDLAAEVARLRAARVRFRNDVVPGPGGSQVLIVERRAISSSCFSRPAADSRGAAKSAILLGFAALRRVAPQGSICYATARFWRVSLLLHGGPPNRKNPLKSKGLRRPRGRSGPAG